jgi:hypothetical protein
MILIVPITACFDASDTRPDQLVWAIDGWVAPTAQWSQFNRDWKLMLKEAPFRPSVKEAEARHHCDSKT